MRKKYILFDFDGTLMNTNGVVIGAWQASAEHFLGHKLPENVILSTFGETLMYSVTYLFPDNDDDEVINYYREAQTELFANGFEVRLFDGMLELLKELKVRGHRIAVVTSRTKESTLRYIDSNGIRDYIDEYVCMEDVSSHKPDPESINVALDKFGATPDEAIMLGDTKYDIGCANNAGVENVLVDWGYDVHLENIRKAGYTVDNVIKEPMELMKIV